MKPKVYPLPFKEAPQVLQWLSDFAQVPAGWIEQNLGQHLEAGKDNRGDCLLFRWPTRPDVVKVRPLYPTPAKYYWTYYWDGGDPPLLWPEPSDPLPARIMLSEGESDAVVARYHGFAAFATTKGCGFTLPDEVIEWLKQQGVEEVIICGDTDQPGREARHKLALTLANAGLSVGVLRLEDGFNPALGLKDLRACWRWWASQLRPAEEFRALLEQLISPVEPFLLQRPAAGAAGAAPALTLVPARQFARTAPTLDWLWKDWLPLGAVVLLAGPAKIGKSSLVAGLISALLDGRLFLGCQARRARAVWLTEEGQSVMAEKLARYGLDVRDDLLIVPRTEQARGLDAIVRALEVLLETSAREPEPLPWLIVVDSLSFWAGWEGDDENKAGTVTATLAQIQRLARPDTAVLLVHHVAKRSGEPRGSSALEAQVDIILRLGVAFNNLQARELSFDRGRLPNPPASLMFNEAMTWAGPGFPRAMQLGLEVLRHLDGQPMTQEELAEATGLSRQRVSEALAWLVQQREVVVEGTGHRGDPRRYRRA